jgi:hypothetical protein
MGWGLGCLNDWIPLLVFFCVWFRGEGYGMNV